MMQHEDTDALAQRVSARLIQVPGVAAVVLGGSRARGAGLPDSDLDLGLYYEPEAPLETGALRELARALDDRGAQADVTEVGAWGPWVNGGGWLRIGGVAVDWLYRDLARVRQVLGECSEGRPTSDYYLGHPHAFHSPIYLGEIHHARVLADPCGVLAPLRARLSSYPPRLRAELMRRFLFDARFMLELAKKPAGRGDVFHVCGCLFRCIAALVQVLYAVNERWCLNEKGALPEVALLPVCPADFGPRAEAILAAPGAAPEALAASVAATDALIRETEGVCVETS